MTSSGKQWHGKETHLECMLPGGDASFSCLSAGYCNPYQQKAAKLHKKTLLFLRNDGLTIRMGPLCGAPLRAHTAVPGVPVA